MTVPKEEAPANTRASSRGKTRGASVIRIDYAYRVRRRFFEC